MTHSKRGIGGHHSRNAGKDEWLTPPSILSHLGEFDLDPCAPILAPWSTAKRQMSILDDGLSRPWEGRVWCNPPYGRETGKWLAKCAEHKNALALIFARTETSDWVDQVWGKAHSILFIFGRLYFHHVDGRRAEANSGAPSALVSYDPFNTLILDTTNIPGRLVVL